MYDKIVLSMLLGILIIGFTQFSFAEEQEKVTSVSLDVYTFELPTRNNYQQITLTGYVEDYFRGERIIIEIISPNGSQEDIGTYASKKGDMYTVIHIDEFSQIGLHKLVIKYRDVEIISTTFAILENK